MQRDPQLVEFSREHYSALKLAKTLRHTTAETFSAHHKLLTQMMAELETHFQEEELLLIPQLAQFTETALIARLQQEHQQLRHLHENANDYRILVQFGELLFAHVRFEERVLFTALQQHWAH
ncbi:hemerythrin domain-containing protein [Chitinibacter sp. SCUT-21]|uniref:hemerythrin domain-containing protein n=1 Tax=Chitinibacter sp. SCUT-21 TaxID=2970891 RepID=UPI0035A71512